MRRLLVVLVAMVWAAGIMRPVHAAEGPAREEVQEALAKATGFFAGEVAAHGGYLYDYSGDLKLREGEGVAPPETVWVQPPGTPAVGEALLRAYAATGDKRHLQAARKAGQALVLGQLHSGGWYYSIEFAPEARRNKSYRFTLAGQPTSDPVKPADRELAAGWDEWRPRKYEKNQTILDDDVTQAATRFLARLDLALDFQDATIHEAANYALRSLLGAQYPNGGWSASYDRFPHAAPSAATYPVLPASYPGDWPRTWPKDFTGCYVTNDDLMEKMIRTLLVAWEVYGDERYLAAAKKAGDFLLLAQMPAPQRAWAQQYDKEMHPVWSRAFEPSAVSSRESLYILKSLLLLYAQTGDKKYLAPIPPAIAYLSESRLPSGQLSRFYELQTNRPLYFTRGKGGKGHVMTYENKRLASNYGFLIEPLMDEIEADYKAALAARPAATQPSRTAGAARQPTEKLTPELAAAARQAVDSLDSRGAWIDRGRMRHNKVEPASGIIRSATFATNVATLCRYLDATRE